MPARAHLPCRRLPKDSLQDQMHFLKPAHAVSLDHPPRNNTDSPETGVWDTSFPDRSGWWTSKQKGKGLTEMNGKAIHGKDS